MDGRILSLVWIAALLPVMLLLASISEAGSRLDARIVERLRSQIAASDAPVMFVGSSLTRNAVIQSGDEIADALHLRVAIGNITMAEILDVLDEAIAPGAEEIYVEINPMAIDRNGLCGATHAEPVATLSAAIRGLGFEARRALNIYVLGAGSARLHEAHNLDQHFVFSPRLANAKRAATFCDPVTSPRFTALRERAELTGTTLAFAAFPRPHSYAERLDPEEETAIRTHYRQVAVEMNLPLFLPERVWPDHYFADHVHLNGAGRERYMRELADWRTGRP